jgi:hypothetical protein
VEVFFSLSSLLFITPPNPFKGERKEKEDNNIFLSWLHHQILTRIVAKTV